MLGRDPWDERDQLMRDVCFIADVAVLPRWMRVSQALDYVAGVHPRFDRAKAEGFLAKTDIRHTSKIRELSKGMVTQLHLALVMAIDAKLLVLDEPTLGLDILYRKQFYDSLLNDYFDRSRTIVVTTHQVEDVQHVLTDLMFINRGRIVLNCSMEEFESRYLEVTVHPEQCRRRAGAQADARAPGARPQHSAVRSEARSRDRQQLAALGDVRTPSIADLFVAVMGNQAAPGAAQMNTQSNAMPESRIPDSQGRSSGLSATRPMYWSIRRELWENRSIYIAPLAVAAVVLFGFLIAPLVMPCRCRTRLSGAPHSKGLTASPWM